MFSTSGTKRSAPAFQLRRVTALIGPYGSGKTELAIGLALWSRQPGNQSAYSRTMLADLDVLKPYFRSREVQDRLKTVGVGLIAPAGALANTDLPILSPEIRGNVSRIDTQLLLDVGGDPVGARALGSVSDVVGAAEYDLLLVLNRYRPFMDSVETVVEQAQQIANAAHLPVTGIISNTNVLEETTLDDVKWGLELSREVATQLKVEVRLVAVSEHLTEAAREFSTKWPPLVAIRRQMMPQFLGGVVLAAPPAAGTPVT